jgi:hypothetical protein
MSEQDRHDGLLSDISRNLSGFFRHLLPGAFVLGAASVAHPSWFAGLNTESWPHIVITGVIALAVGKFSVFPKSIWI